MTRWATAAAITAIRPVGDPPSGTTLVEVVVVARDDALDGSDWPTPSTSSVVPQPTNATTHATRSTVRTDVVRMVATPLPIA